VREAARRVDATILHARLLAIGAMALALPAEETIGLLDARSMLMQDAVDGQCGRVCRFRGDPCGSIRLDGATRLP
jgi:class 3 adenylate cyclase